MCYCVKYRRTRFCSFALKNKETTRKTNKQVGGKYENREEMVGVLGLYSSGSRQGQVASSFEHGNEHSVP
jgi:hypothetical protein